MAKQFVFFFHFCFSRYFSLYLKAELIRTVFNLSRTKTMFLGGSKGYFRALWVGVLWSCGDGGGGGIINLKESQRFETTIISKFLRSK